jgi:hypothetical protein
MKQNTPRVRLRIACRVLAMFGAGALSIAVPAGARAAESAAEPLSRYPFDPVCPWGRVSDGRGMLVRCLLSAEATRLAAGPLSSQPERAPVAPGASPPSMPAAPAVSDPAVAAVALAPLITAAPPARRVVVKSLSPARADTGDLPEAQRQLRKAEPRYVQCVETNGGLEGNSASVTFRFLVRERGRAEGVAVKERRGLSVGAAKCIADVIDRRYVGYPAAPIVGATITVELGAEPARTP